MKTESFLIFLVVFSTIAFSLFYFGYHATEETGIVGHITAYPAESATTFTGLAIVVFLIWFTFNETKKPL